MVRLREAHPEWRAGLRRLVLSDELLTVGDLIRGLAEAQSRTEGRVEELAAAQARADRRVDELFQALAQLGRRVDGAEAPAQLTRRVEALAEAQRLPERELAQLAEGQRQLEWRVPRLEAQVGRVVGSDLERRCRERAPAYLGRLLRRPRLVDTFELAGMLEEAVRAGRIGEEEALEAVGPTPWCGGWTRGGRGGLRGGGVVHGVRARRRAGAPARRPSCPGPGLAGAPAVAGELIPEGVRRRAERAGVWRFTEGRAQAPAEVPPG